MKTYQIGLYEKAVRTGKKVRMERFPRGRHMNLPSFESYWMKVKEFLDELDTDQMTEGFFEDNYE